MLPSFTVAVQYLIFSEKSIVFHKKTYFQCFPHSCNWSLFPFSQSPFFSRLPVLLYRWIGSPSGRPLFDCVSQTNFNSAYIERRLIEEQGKGVREMFAHK